MTLYGVWTHSDGGFISDPGTGSEAQALLNGMIAADHDNREDLTIERACDWHPDQRWHSCETCAAENNES
jgi:hypothetical protein